ncbi:MAG: TRAP transporter small permease subunit [Spirochaetales bacterium]|jgi:TRAP-type C4-dicarboxylate transport system permease small subunit|nr:TRAP transporter small permease subunit [Spirochaetales bacterium]
MNAILKFRDLIEKFILVIAVTLLSLVAILIAMQVLLRAINIGVDWTEEFSRFSYVGVTFLGSVLAITKGKHITIDFLANLLPASVRKALAVAVHILMAVFMAICTYGSTLIMAAARGVGSNSMSWFKLNYIYGLVLASCVLMILVSLIRALETALQGQNRSKAGIV